MKKLQTLLLAICICGLLSGTSNGYVNNRHQWWEIRLQKLLEEKRHLAHNNKIDKNIIEYIDHEIKQARKVIAIFNNEQLDNGSLSFETRIITAEEIRGEISRIAPPLLSIAYLTALVHEYSNRDNITYARTLVNDRLSTEIRERFNRDGRDLINNILVNDITPDDWKNLSFEIFFGRMIQDRNTIENSYKNDLYTCISSEMDSRHNRSNIKELRDLILREAIQKMREYNIYAKLDRSTGPMTSSWTWEKLYTFIDHDFTTYESAIDMIGKGSSISLDRIRTLCDFPSELDPIIFNNLRRSHLDNRVYKPSFKESKDENIIFMKIPRCPNSLAMIKEIDTLRKQTVLTISGKEDEEFFNDLNIRFSRILIRHTGEIYNQFRREREKVEAITGIDDNNAKQAEINIKNEEDFQKAYGIFKSKVSLARRYKEKSMKFIKWVWKSRSMSGKTLVSLYRKQLSREKHYIEFLSKLIAQGTRISEYYAPVAHKQFVNSYRRTADIYRFIGISLSIPQRISTYLDPRERTITRQLKSEFMNIILSSRHKIRQSINEYNRKKGLADKKRKEMLARLRGRIAQYEIDLQQGDAREQIRLVESYQYGEEVLTDYLITFKKMEGQVRTGTMSPSLQQIFHRKSIFAVLENFDRERLIREYYSRQYLKRSASMTLARLVTLLSYYRKCNVTIFESPSLKEIQALKSRLNNHYQVRVSKWSMNETNFKEIDKKAVKLLTTIRNRKIWEDKNRNPTVSRSMSTDKVITITHPSLSMSIPEGWEEDSLNDRDRTLGVMKSFSSIDSASTIRVVRVPSDETNTKSVSEQWLTNAGDSLVEKKWGNHKGFEYFWILSKDRHRNISETYALKKDGYVVIISGKTARHLYSYFRKKMKMVVNSIKL